MMTKYLLLVFLFLSHTTYSQLSYTIDSVSFGSLVDFEGGQAELQFTDINQDGNMDLITVGDHGSPFINTTQHGISVLFGDGTGTAWTLFQNGDFGYGGIAVGDINNDKLLDVAYGVHHNYSTTDFGDQLLEAALGDGTGMNWTPWDDSLGTAGETYGMFGTDLGDVNNDGLLDICSGSFGCCAGTHVYLNLGTGAWQHSYGYINGNTEHYVQFGDINHDGNLDFVCCHQNGAAYFGDGTGGFILKHNNLPALNVLGFYDICLADADNDGDDDFAFVHNSIPYVYKWNDSTQMWVNISAGLLPGGTTYTIKMNDLDVDGYADIVMVGSYGVKIYHGNGGISWSNILTIPLPNINTCQDITIADIDHNGFPEIAFLAEFQTGIFSNINKLKILVNDSTVQSVSIKQNYPAGRECFPGGAVRFIKWNSSVPSGHSSSVNIELSTTGPAGPWTTILNNAPDNGTFQWTVPSSTVSADCFIRLIVMDSITSQTDTSVNAIPFNIGTCVLTTGVTEPLNKHSSVVYPNPLNREAQIFSGLTNASIRIFDADGRMVKALNEIVSFPVTLNARDLSPGIYFAVISNDSEKETLKLIVY